MELNQELNRLFPDRTVIAFCYSNRNVIPTLWMGALADKLRQRGYAVIGLLTPVTAHLRTLPGIEPTFTVRGAEIASLSRVTLFISTNLEWQVPWPENSLALAVQHCSAPLPDIGCFLRHAHCSGAFDGYILGFSFWEYSKQIRKMWAGFAPPGWNKRKRPNFYLMGYGFPKLCALREIIKKMEKPDKNTITFAQHYTKTFPEYGLDRIRKLAFPVLKKLLESFPGHNIIYRPNPNDLGNPALNEIRSFFASEPRFILDENKEYIGTMAMSRCMVSDFSTIAMTYSILTGNPSVYYKPWEDYEEHRDLLNFYTRTLDQMVAGVEKAISMPAVEKENLAASTLTKRGYLPFDHSLDELADDISDFIADRPKTGWLPIPRHPAQKGAPIVRIANRIFAEPPRLMAAHANFLAQYRYNSFLAWLSLWLYKNKYPDLPVDRDLFNLAVKDRGYSRFPGFYRDVKIPVEVENRILEIAFKNNFIES